MSRATDRAILDGLGRYLHELGLVRYSPAGPAPADRPLYRVGLLPETSDAAVAVNLYGHTTARGDRGTPDVRVQFRFRHGTYGDVLDLADAFYDALDDRSRLTLPGGVRVLHSTRVVTADAVEDSNHRWERPDSYRLTLNPKE